MNSSPYLTRYQRRLLSSSIKALNPLTIDYRDQAGQETVRLITPLPDTPAHSGLFVAWCHLREDIRNFRLDRILRVRKARTAPEIDRQRLEESREGQRIDLPGDVMTGQLPSEQRQLLYRSVENLRPMRIIYQDKSGALSERTVTPLSFDPPQEHLFAAWCHMRDQERNFSYDRVKWVETTDEDVKVPEYHLTAAQKREMINPRHDNFRLDHAGPGAWVGSTKLSELDHYLLQVAAGDKEKTDELLSLIHRGEDPLSQLAFQLGNMAASYTDEEGTTVVAFPAAAFALGVRCAQMRRALNGTEADALSMYPY